MHPSRRRPGRDDARRGFLVPISTALLVAVVVAACGTSATVAPSAGTDSAGPTPTGAPPSPEGGPSGAPPGTDASPTPAATGPGTSRLGGERLTVLVIGLDTLAGRTPTRLTDVMLVASIDPVAGTASMFSLPRDLTDVPLPGGGTYRRKLNGLYAEVLKDPGAFSGAAVGPERFLADTIEAILDVDIDHWVAVDMDGFADIIDAIGGIDVRVTDGFCDPTYHGLGINGFAIAPGTWHLDGAEALAYARVRKAEGEDDFKRMLRQQVMLVALGEALRSGAAADDPLGVLASLGSAVRTDLPPEAIVDLAAVGKDLDRADIHARVAQPTRFVTPEIDARGYVLLPNLAELRRYGEALFGPSGEKVSTGTIEPDDIPAPSAGKALPAYRGC